MKQTKPKSCVICGSAFQMKAGQQVTCGPECSRERKNLRALERSKTYRVSAEYKCKWCNKKFRPKAVDRTTYCSRSCAYANKAATRVTPEERRQRRRQLRQNKATLRGWTVAQSAAISRGVMQWLKDYQPCRECGRMTLPGSDFCSGQCKAIARLSVEREAFDLWCVGCGETFTTKSSRAKRCVACRKRMANGNACHYERAGRLCVDREHINPRDIFARDGYVCQICNERTDPTKKVPHPNSPTLDHIIPMSKGGPHTADNVQCACWTCNCKIKVDRMPWELNAAQGILCDMVAACT